MRFAFNERKSTQAAGHLLELAGGSMQRLKLMKLLYVADRRALIDTGCSITGARMVSLEFGPVLSDVMECATGATDGCWPQAIQADAENDELLTGATGTDELSEYDVEVLDDVYREFEGIDRIGFADYQHDSEFPEWSRPDGPAVTIDPRVILRSKGWSEEEIALAVEDVEAVRSFHAQFA